MSEFYQFAGGSPWLTFFLLWLVLYAITWVVALPFRLAKRWLRSRDIQARGWPPEHCDADGDFRPVPEADT